MANEQKSVQSADNCIDNHTSVTNANDKSNMSNSSVNSSPNLPTKFASEEGVSTAETSEILVGTHTCTIAQSNNGEENGKQGNLAPLSAANACKSPLKDSTNLPTKLASEEGEITSNSSDTSDKENQVKPKAPLSVEVPEVNDMTDALPSPEESLVPKTAIKFILKNKKVLIPVDPRKTQKTNDPVQPIKGSNRAKSQDKSSDNESPDSRSTHRHSKRDIRSQDRHSRRKSFHRRSIPRHSERRYRSRDMRSRSKSFDRSSIHRHSERRYRSRDRRSRSQSFDRRSIPRLSERRSRSQDRRSRSKSSDRRSIHRHSKRIYRSQDRRSNSELSNRRSTHRSRHSIKSQGYRSRSTHRRYESRQSPGDSDSNRSLLNSDEGRRANTVSDIELPHNVNNETILREYYELLGQIREDGYLSNTVYPYIPYLTSDFSPMHPDTLWKLMHYAVFEKQLSPEQQTQWQQLWRHQLWQQLRQQQGPRVSTWKS